MNRKQFGLMMLLALIAGLIGGVVSTQWFIAKNVYAAKSIKPQKVIEAEEFRVVDGNGGILATLGMSKIYGIPAVELRMFTAAYGKKSGIIITAKETGSTMNIYGNDRNNNIGIEMRVYNSLPAIGGTLELPTAFASLEIGYSGTNMTAALEGEKIIEENKSHIEISSIESGASLGLFDSKGNRRAVLGTVGLETMRTGEVSKRPESSFVLLDKDGKVILSLP